MSTSTNLATDIATNIGGVNLKTCIFNASGCWCTTRDELTDLVNSDAGAVVSKSGTVKLRKGNPEPRLHTTDTYGSINSMGVPNLGFDFYTKFFNDTKDNKPYFQSLIPFSQDDLRMMLKDIDDNANSQRLIEVNLSCPNLIRKSIVGYNFELFEEYVGIMQETSPENLVLGIKLPPYYQNHEFDTVSEIILKYPIVKFITCINSVVNGLIIDTVSESTTIHPKNGLGGIGGVYCRPTALANVNQFYRRLNGQVDILGCGGVQNGRDVFAHLLAGACAVEVGTQLMKEGPELFTRLNSELVAIMNKKNYGKISECVGKLKVIAPIDN